MTRRGLKRLALGAVLCIVAITAVGMSHRLRWRERPDSASGVALVLRPERQTIRLGEVPRLTVAVVNRGEQTVVLVEPGDGSGCGWRTPLVQWSQHPWHEQRMCGNVNPLRAEEVFNLAPGESRELGAWVGRPYLPRPGRYRVAVRYRNVPDHEWLGIPLGKPDFAAMQAVRQSTRVDAVSNSVEIVVEK